MEKLIKGALLANHHTQKGKVLKCNLITIVTRLAMGKKIIGTGESQNVSNVKSWAFGKEL